MGRRLSVAELEERARVRRAREAYKKANPTERSQTYKKKVADDYIAAYYRDPLEIGRYLRLTVNKGHLIRLGGGEVNVGYTRAGLLNQVDFDALTSPTLTTVERGSKIPIIKIQMIYGDATAVVVAANQAHGRYVKKYDEKDGQSHRLLPFVGVAKASAFTAANINLDSIKTAFITLFNETNKNAIVGESGTAILGIGYGNQFVPLARVR